MRNEEKEISLNYEKRKTGLLGSNHRRTTKIEAKINFLFEKSNEIDNLPENNSRDKIIKVK